MALSALLLDLSIKYGSVMIDTTNEETLTTSTHKAEVVPVVLEPHPNADSLSIVRVFGGYTVCVRTSDWSGIDKGVYVPPDSIVDTSRDEFAFLAGSSRVKVRKIRGVPSQGLLIPAPFDAVIGEDMAQRLGITHYEPPLPAAVRHGEIAKAPSGHHPRYDIDTLHRYAHVMIPGEPLWITEKIHGANARFCCVDGELHVGSKAMWRRQSDTNIWWAALRHYPELIDFCREHPHITVYGEVYGSVQSLRYGTRPGEVRLVIFDLLRYNEWVSPKEAIELAPNLPWVPRIAEDAPFDLNHILDLAEGNSLIPGAGHIREGIVVKPLVERFHPEVGRVCLKVVSNAYLEQS